MWPNILSEVEICPVSLSLEMCTTRAEREKKEVIIRITRRSFVVSTLTDATAKTLGDDFYSTSSPFLTSSFPRSFSLSCFLFFFFSKTWEQGSRVYGVINFSPHLITYRVTFVFNFIIAVYYTLP